MPNDMTLMFADARRGTLDCRPTPVCDPRPVCPACGGLECLCRPRFFAGQLLSEEDLNRLDYYIVAKNRLHNRYLFGTGVVCGLEVVCSPCDPAGGGTVIVKPGYALSPCGNDIVVCKEEAVDVCDLINRCRPRPPDDCYQPGNNPADCVQGDEDWVLAICYQEKQSRGITALRGASCGCGANCGCSGGCGCGCGGATSSGSTYGAEASCGCGGGVATKTAKTKPAAKPGPIPPQCEPTLTCEGYTFAVYRVPKADEKVRDPGALIRRFLCCLEPLVERLSAIPLQNVANTQRQDWILSLQAAVREFLVTEGLYDCDLAARLGAVALPSLGAEQTVYLQGWSTATLAIFAIIAAVFQKCLCAALLPPCPPPEMNDCVPIATVTVARGHCRVRRICNIGNRRFLLTFPNLRYWLSWLPIFSDWNSGSTSVGGTATPSRTLRDLVTALCCTPIAEKFDFTNIRAVELRPRERLTRRQATASASTVHPFTEMFAESLAGGEKANAATLMLAALGVRRADASALASDTALEHPGEAMLVQEILAPAVAPFMSLVGGGRAASDEKVEALAREVAALKETVERQKDAINRMRRPPR